MRRDDSPPEPASTANGPLAVVRARIAAAARVARRDPHTISLIAVSKTRTSEEILPLIAQGQTAFGENRVQEAQAKWPLLRTAAPDLALHLVGQLQSNKADDAVAMFDVIHSVDRPSLIDALARAVDRQRRAPDCFIQVNLADEMQKGGCPPSKLGEVIASALAAGLRVTGLMTVPPVGLEPAPWFALLAKLAGDHGLPGLSMGMSDDFETAVMLGATHVRVGTALFGARG